MELAVGIVALLTVVIVVAGLSSRFDLPSPLVLIVVGIVGSFLPIVPDVELRPEVVLLGLLPPLLYAASLQTSLVDFNKNRRSILLLSVGLVAFTTIGVGAVVHGLLPGVGWPASFAIGAVVAPPDAVAATSIGRRIGLPRRIVTILEGESLLNDATALVSLRAAILAGAAASMDWRFVVVDFVVAALGGVLVGLAFYVVVAFARRRLSDPALDSAISFLVPFAAYLAAEEINLGDARPSGVLAVVVAGLLLGHRAPILQTAQSRIAERLNWRSIAFVLESVVFLLIGLQAARIIDGAAGGTVTYPRIAAVCVAVLVAVVVLRMAWVFAARYLLIRPGPDGVTGAVPPWGYTALLGWAGMRGVVTLAAAFVIPSSTPQREVLLLIAFTTTAGTLLLQGTTLPWLARRLHAPPPDATSDALARANVLHQATAAALTKLAEIDAEHEEDLHGTSTTLRDRLERRDFAAWERVNVGQDATPSEIYARRRRLLIDAERRRVLEIRSVGTMPHEVIEQVLAMLDVEESMLEFSEAERGRVRSSGEALAKQGLCQELSAGMSPVEPDHPGECWDCVDEGQHWVHLRMCETCGHVACCDSSEGRHASRHHGETKHPVMRSAEPGEAWRWCFVHEITG